MTGLGNECHVSAMTDRERMIDEAVRETTKGKPRAYGRDGLRCILINSEAWGNRAAEEIYSHFIPKVRAHFAEIAARNAAP